MAVASLILAIIAILVAGASAAYTRKQATEQARVASIEHDRRHDELTPEFKITCVAQEQDGNRAELTLALTGPAGLTGLHEVAVRIRDDIPDRQPRFGSQLTQEQVSAVIWGPYRIVTGLKDTDANGRAHGPFRLLKNEPYPIPLERSLLPSWMSDPERWREQYEGKPVRLEIICQRHNIEPWVIPAEVQVDYPPQAYVI
jgi:hypothetical protein